MMKLLDTDGAWIAIGISVFFLVVGVLMKRVFVQILKASPPPPDTSKPSVSESTHD